MADAVKSDGRLLFDCLSAVLLLLVAVLGACMPKYLASKGSLQQGTASSLAFHLGNMLSGGVMLSAGFCHLLADALRQLAFVGRFPMAPFLAACGYLITLLADQVVQLLTTDAEGDETQQLSPQPGFNNYPGDHGLGSAGAVAHGRGFRPSPSPSPAGAGFAGFIRSSLGQKGWGYSRLEDTSQQYHHQQPQGGSSSCQEGAIELITSNGVCHNSSSTAGAGAAPVLANGSAAHCSSLVEHVTGVTPHVSASCCHNPASCACCLARSHAPTAADVGQGFRTTSTAQNPGAAQQPGSGQDSTAGYTRRPGSAGGIGSAGLGLGSAARTRSLTNPGIGPALSPLQAAAAGELGGHAGMVASAAGSSDPPAAAAAGVDATAATPSDQAAAAAAPAPAVAADVVGSPPLVLPVSTSVQRGAAATSGNAQDDALCLLAAGSPRSVSAAGLHPRSPKFKSAAAASAGLIQQQQQQVQAPLANSCHLQDQQQQQQPPLPLQQRQQQQLLSPSEPHRTNSSIAQMLMQPVRQLSLPMACGCCCGAGGCRSALSSAQPDMTEACTVARVAGHLELEVMSTTTGGHNHGHFQVFLSQRPLSFATSLLLACALCIHSILEGLALGAQQSMQATEDIMLAIAAHKGLAAYALGASIVESGASDSKFWVVVGLFAAATPLGILIGYGSSVVGHGPVSAAMSALASGTFLYVALNEVIPKELEHPDGHRLAKVAALLLGFGLMSLLAVWA